MKKSNKNNDANSKLFDKEDMELLKSRIYYFPGTEIDKSKIQHLQILIVTLWTNLWKEYEEQTEGIYRKQIEELWKNGETEKAKKKENELGGLLANAKGILCRNSKTAKNFLEPDATSDNQAQYAIAGAFLYNEGKLQNPEGILSLLQKEKQKIIAVFRKTYKTEFEQKKQIRDYLFYWNNNPVTFSKFSIEVENKKHKWETAKVTAYNEEDKKFVPAEESADRTQLFFIDQSPSTSFYTIYDGWQLTYFLINDKGDFSAHEINQATYTTLSHKSHLPLCGIGIFVHYEDVNKTISEINGKGKIDDYITAMLYQRFLTITTEEQERYENKTLDKLPDTDILNDIDGSWQTYHYRLNKKIGDEYASGIEVGVLTIETNGLVRLLFSNHKNEYKGFISFPIATATHRFAKCSLDLSANQKIYRLHLFLSLFPDNDSLEGIISGWSLFNKPFSSIIRLDRPKKGSSEKVELPHFVPQKEFAEKLKVSVIKFFNDKPYLSFPSFSFLSDPDRSLQKFDGNYYVISQYYRTGYYNKARLTIQNGIFTITYFSKEHGDVVYTGDVKEVRVPWHLFFNILSVKHKARQESHGGCYYFSLESLSLPEDFSKLAEEVKYLQGMSVRINTGGKIIARKEYLVASKEENLFLEAHLKSSFMNQEELSFNIRMEEDEQWIDTLSNGLRSKKDNLLLLDPQDEDENKDTDYAELYFDAFLYKALHTKDYSSQMFYNLLQTVLISDIKTISEKIEHLFSELEITDESRKRHLIADIERLLEIIKISCQKNLYTVYRFLFIIEKKKRVINDQKLFPVIKKIIQQIRELNQR